MIEECFGLDKIEYLQSHENIEIYQKAFHLIETYFGVDDEENSPAVNKKKFNKSFFINLFFQQQGESRPFEFGTTINNPGSTMNGQINQQGQFQF